MHAEQHIVQLYGDDDGLIVSAVGGYVAEGLSRGEGAVLIATPEHCEAFAAHLAAAGTEAMAAVREGRLLFLDAAETLARFMVDGRPDRERFETVIGAVIAEVRARTGRTELRAYGEMVGLLWTDGEVDAAVELEEHWNALLETSGIRLFCGYPIDVFGEEFDAARLGPILCTHSRLLTANGGLARALDRAMDELLGPGAESVRREVAAMAPPTEWGAVPDAESTILWLRTNLPRQAPPIIARARYYRASYLSVP
jgi:hypothetical protein